MWLLFCHCRCHCGCCHCCLFVFVSHRLAFMTSTLSVRMLSLGIKLFEEKRRAGRKKLHMVCAYVPVCRSGCLYLHHFQLKKNEKLVVRVIHSRLYAHGVMMILLRLCNHFHAVVNVELKLLYMVCLHNNHFHDFKEHTYKCQCMRVNCLCALVF